MQKVLQFLIERINFIIFLILEVLAFVLIYSNNPYQGSAFFNSSNNMIATVGESSNSVKEYLSLRDINDDLARENAYLRKLLSQNKISDDITIHLLSDTAYIKKYSYVAAKVINNSVANFHNYLTINKGWADSIAPGMGVICRSGIVGKVKTCSKNFSTVTSVLHKEMLVSSKLKKANAVGSLRWEGVDAQYGRLMYIPRHIQVKSGDTVTTSEFNSVFPEGEMVGIVDKIKIKGDENFFNIRIKLSTDFSKLNYVYVIRNKLKFQQDSLELLNTEEKNESK